MQFNSLAHCLVPRRVSANQTHEISVMSEAIGNTVEIRPLYDPIALGINLASSAATRINPSLVGLRFAREQPSILGNNQSKPQLLWVKRASMQFKKIKKRANQTHESFIRLNV